MSVRFRIVSVFLVSCLLVSGALEAQRENPLNPQLGSTRQDSIPTGILPLDTLVPMTYVLMDDPSTIRIDFDTTLRPVPQHLPLQFEQAHLGNYGSAVRSLAPEAQDPIGYASGWFQYDPYFLHDHSFRYYHQDIPAAKIRFSQASQEDTHLDVDFGRSFARGLSLSIAYKRINQIGEFFNQRQKNTGLGFGVWHHAPSGQYDAFYNFISNAAVAQENGGILSDTFIGQALLPDVEIPTWIRNGLTEQRQRTLVTRQILHLTGDSAGLGIDLWVKGKWATGLYKYVDTEAVDYSSYYGPLFLNDQRGIRQFVFDRQWEWSGGISLPWRAAHSTLEASLRYRNIKVEQEPQIRKINEVYLEASGLFQWIEPLVLKGELTLGLGQANGAFSFRATGDLKTGILGHLKGSWSIRSRLPYLVESSLFVNQQEVYSATLRQPLVNEIGVGWEIEEQDFHAGITWQVYDNFIYFDAVPQPRQIEESFSLRRFYLSKGFDFNGIALKGKVIWQPDARSELAIPELLYQAGVFGRLRLFQRKLALIPFMDVMYHDGFAGTTYFPVTGTYHLTDGRRIPDYFRMDAGMAIQIRFLKMYLRMDDIVGAFQDRALWQAELYPHYRGYLRIGLEAGFFN